MCHAFSLTNFIPFIIEQKIFPTKSESFILDTSSAPGTAPNLDYWDAALMMGFESGVTYAGPLEIAYRDVVEVLFDGLEPK